MMSGGMTTSRKAVCIFIGSVFTWQQRSDFFFVFKREKCFYLAHVLASVFHLHTLDVQRPRVVVIVRHRQSPVIGDDVLVDGQNGFSISLYPGNLFTTRSRALFTMNINKYSMASMADASIIGWSGPKGNLCNRNIF